MKRSLFFLMLQELRKILPNQPPTKQNPPDLDIPLLNNKENKRVHSQISVTLYDDLYELSSY